MSASVDGLLADVILTHSSSTITLLHARQAIVTEQPGLMRDLSVN